MRRVGSTLAVLIVLTAFLGAAAHAQDQSVGRFTQVSGQVDILKAGKLPAAPVKVSDQVHTGDLIRTKTQSKAQVQFIDDTLLDISPNSRVVIDQYIFDGATQRQATLRVLLGMVYTTVTKLFRKDRPDFTIETETAVIGVRGTKTFVLRIPRGTDVYNEQGTVQGSNINPAVSGFVLARNMEFFRVGENQPPTIPIPFSMQDLQNLRRVLDVGLMGRVGPPGQTSGQPAYRPLGVQPGLQEGTGLPGGVTIPTIPPQLPAKVLPFHGS